MTNDRTLLAELHGLLKKAWDERRLPADIVPAELVGRIDRCLADEPYDARAHQSRYP